MGTISQKLTYLNDTKGLLKESINDVGGELTDESTFRSYAEALNGVYDNLPKITPPASNELYFKALNGKMEKSYYGDISQDTSILPDEYTEVDYIESSGTQYIDTGYKHNTSKTSYEATLSISNLTNTTNTLFGARITHNGTEAYYLGLYQNGGSFGCIGGTKKDSIGWNASTDVKYHILYNALTGLTVDGTNYPIASSSNITYDKNDYIFALNSNRNVLEKSNFKLYSFKIKENNTLVREFIPCYRNSDSVVGLYDLVNGVFYTNQGTGSFTYGSVVTIPNPDYPQNVQVVKGKQIVKFEGKNLFDKDWFNDFTTSVQYIQLELEPNTQYTLSSNIPTQASNTDNANLFLMLQNESASSYSNGVKPNQPRTITTDSSGILKIGYRDFGNEYSDEKNKYWYMLNEGSSANNYEPYHAPNTYELNLKSKNLLPYPYTESTVERYGITYTARADGSILVNGTSTNNNASFSLLGDYRLENQKPFIGDYIVGATNEVRMRASNHTGSTYTTLATDTGSGARIDKSTYDIGYIELYVPAGTTVNNVVIKPMLLNSLEDTKYEPYFDYELCKIDTAEDVIKKSTGKNLFDKDTMVLNGGIASDTGILSANSNYRTAYASVKPNKAYTISKNVSSRFIVSLYNGTNLIMPITTTNPIVNNNASSMTVITNNDTKYIFVTYASGTDVANDATIRNSIQIEER